MQSKAGQFILVIGLLALPIVLGAAHLSSRREESKGPGESRTTDPAPATVTTTTEVARPQLLAEKSVSEWNASAQATAAEITLSLIHI